MEPVLVIAGIRLGDTFEIRVFSLADKGLSPILKRKIGGNDVVDPEGKIIGILINFSSDVACCCSKTFGSYILLLIIIESKTGRK